MSRLRTITSRSNLLNPCDQRQSYQCILSKTRGLLAIKHDVGLFEKYLHCKTAVFCCFKRALLDPLKAEDQPVQNTEKGALGILVKATLPTKMPFFFCCFFLGLHPQHVEVPRLGVESELQPPAYTRATARPDPSCVCNLHHSSQQCGSLTH